MPSTPRLTNKQAEFARLVAGGKRLSDSYRSAYKTLGNLNTVRVEACRLAKHPLVVAEIERLIDARQNRLSNQEQLAQLRSRARSLGLLR